MRRALRCAMTAMLLASCGGSGGPDDPDSDAGMDASVEPDAGTPPDAGPVWTNIAEEWGATTHDTWAWTCNCTWEEVGFDSPEHCMSIESFNETVTGCHASTYDEYAADLADWLECETAATRGVVACAEEAGCDTRTELSYGPWRAAIDACAAPRPSALTAWHEAVDRCLTGMPSGCPDVSDTGGTTGDGVFTGTTLGAGDDVTPSCGGGTPVPDVLIEWTVPSDATWFFDTTGSDFAGTIFLLDGCDGAELACSPFFTSMFLRRGRTIVVGLEGRRRESGAGNYVVSITPL